MKNEITQQVNSITQLTPEQTDLLTRTICKGADKDEFQLFVGQCNRTGLDPFSRQIHAVKRYDGKLQRNVMTIQTGIDGFRLIADRTKLYDGQEGPFWCGEDGVWKDVWLGKDAPMASKVGVLKKGCERVFWGVATMMSYAQKTKEGDDNKFWRQMPDVMLAKCAEALALRKAFPQDLSGMYVDEELDHNTEVESKQPTKRVVDIGDNGQRVESRAPIQDTPKAAPTPAPEPKKEVVAPVKNETSECIASLRTWIQEKGIEESFIMECIRKADPTFEKATSLEDVSEELVSKFNTAGYRKHVIKLSTESKGKVEEPKTIDLPKEEPAKPIEQPVTEKPVAHTDGYQADPDDKKSLRELHPDNPYKPDQIDLESFQIHFPAQHKGKHLDQLDADYLKGFFFRWKPKPFNGKINDNDFKLDAALVKWGMLNNVQP